MPIKPIDLRKLDTKTDNLYEAVVVAGKRARQINEDNRLEFNQLVSTMIPAVEEDYEERGNPDQEKVSLQFEKREKPHLQALTELLEGDLEFRYKDSE
ncbi:MAG: DNA-directed RNA polymerase subunit omega [Melioribacteraceae bacterium]|nr:DNA-directed RNA polymerase subunit omega [Melioribacteraceae bacterium]